jgi:hypothetical protein
MNNDDGVSTDKARELAAVMAAYRALPTEQLIAEAILLTHGPEMGPRLAGAVVMGFTRSGHYIDTARGLIDQIVGNLEQISWHMSAYSVIRDRISKDYNASPLAMRELTRAVAHQLGAKTLSLRSEVHWHLYTECLDRAWFFMVNSAKHFDSGFTLMPVHQVYVVTIREFRNHLAHRDKAISNIDSPDWHAMSRTVQGWHEIGYKRDKRNRIIFSPVSGDLKGRTLKMPMSLEGFQQFKNIIAYTYERLERLSLDRLTHLFTVCPESIPTVEQVGKLSRDVIEPVE